MASFGPWASELLSREEGTSSTTQPYVDDELEHLLDSGCSTPAGEANAANGPEKANAASGNSVQSHGMSLACQTPSPVPQNRANFQIHAAAANSRDQCAAPSSSKFQFTAGESSTELHSPSSSNIQINAANSNGPCSPSAHEARGPSLASPPVSKTASSLIQCRSEYPLTPGEEDDGRTTGATFHDLSRSLSYFSQPAMCSPSLPTRGEASGCTTPVSAEWECTPGATPTQGTGTNPAWNETENIRKRLVSRDLFSVSSPAKARKIISNDVTTNLLQFDGPAIQSKTSDSRTEGPTCSTIDIHKRNIFGEPQLIPFPVLNPHLRALGNLDFTTAFQLLERLKGRNLEETFSLGTIEKLMTIPKANVQAYLLHLEPRQNWRNLCIREAPFTENPRFECCANLAGRLSFKGPEGFLCRWARREGRRECRQIMKEGIIVGLRYYQYWTHKDTGNDFKKKTRPVDEEFWSATHCYFVCTSSEAEVDKTNKHFKQFRTIREARCYMMHIHTTPNISKYTARLQLALSQTQHIDLDLSTISVTLEEDLQCKDDMTGLKTICTDGAGYISVDLANEIAASLNNGTTNPEKVFGNQEYPSLIQIRLFHNGSASKGTLLAHNTLGRRTIVLRKSMQKVESDPELSDFQSFNSLEICGYSKPPREAKLSRELIVLLTLGGVPRSFFTKLVDKAIENVGNIVNDPRAAWMAIQDWNNDNAKLARRMLLAGIPPKEPFLQKTLMGLRKDLLQDFRKGRVSLPDSCYLYGTADPTGTLEPNQVAITMGYGLVSWPHVGVFKSPGKHPGDFHDFEAIANKEIQDVVGSGKYVIFFSTKGSRSIPDEIASSDLDGDKYFITWNDELLAHYAEHKVRWLKKPDESVESAVCKPVDLPWEELEDRLIYKFINARFSNRNDVGTVANWWLTHMDLYLFLRECDPDQSKIHYEQALELVGYFYALVDSEKTGIKVNYPKRLGPERNPHFLENSEKHENSRKGYSFGYCTYMRDKKIGYGIYFKLDNIYRSTTILGEIYDKALRAEENWKLHSYVDIELEQAFKVTENNFSLSDLCREWSNNYAAYNEEMNTHMSLTESDPSLGESGCSSIYLKYRRHLYDADSLNGSTRELDILFANASAIYAVVYQEAKSDLSRGRAPKFSFAWKVAGTLLCSMFEKYYRRKGEDPLVVSVQALERIFGKSPCQDTREDNICRFEEDSDVL